MLPLRLHRAERYRTPVRVRMRRLRSDHRYVGRRRPVGSRREERGGRSSSYAWTPLTEVLQPGTMDVGDTSSRTSTTTSAPA